MYCAHRDLHVLTHSFPTRRSSDLERTREEVDKRIPLTANERILSQLHEICLSHLDLLLVGDRECRRRPNRDQSCEATEQPSAIYSHAPVPGLDSCSAASAAPSRRSATPAMRLSHTAAPGLASRTRPIYQAASASPLSTGTALA